MELKLNNKEGVRCEGREVFIEVRAEAYDDNEHYNECITVSTYFMHQIFLVKKKGGVRLFSFRSDDKVCRKALGDYSDGEVIFTNSQLMDD